MKRSTKHRQNLKRKGIWPKNRWKTMKFQQKTIWRTQIRCFYVSFAVFFPRTTAKQRQNLSNYGFTAKKHVILRKKRASNPPKPFLCQFCWFFATKTRKQTKVWWVVVWNPPKRTFQTSATCADSFRTLKPWTRTLADSCSGHFPDTKPCFPDTKRTVAVIKPLAKSENSNLWCAFVIFRQIRTKIANMRKIMKI